MSVPRVWEKIEERITAVASQITGLKRNLAAWAREKSPMGTLGEINNKPLPGLWRVAKLLLFDKIKESLGLDQCEIFIFSAAPLKESTRLFFVNLNIFLHNCYGMSELAGPQTFTNPQNWSSFTSEAFLKEAGQCLDGAEISIANPDAEGNGEICLRGRNVFMGYFKNEMETVETIDSRGFVHSGDVGILSSNKSLSITGRIKELLITAGGENVAPVLIENQIHTFLPIFSTVVVIGDKLKYLTCLLCLKLKDKDTLAQEVV